MSGFSATQELEIIVEKSKRRVFLLIRGMKKELGGVDSSTSRLGYATNLYGGSAGGAT